MLKRSLLAAVFALVGTVGLSGCETGAGYGAAALKMRADGRGLDVAICRSTDADRLNVSVRGGSAGDDWVTLVTYEGRHTFSAGDIVSLGEPIEGMNLVESAPVQIESGQEYSFTVNGEPELFADWGAVDWTSADDGWLQVNHSPNRPAVTSKSCPLESSSDSIGLGILHDPGVGAAARH